LIINNRYKSHEVQIKKEQRMESGVEIPHRQFHIS